MAKFLTLFFCLFYLRGIGQASWIAPATRAIDQNSAGEFTNLKVLDSALKEVRVVSLGEQTHSDGATFDAKVQLIKYLHERLGFNVLAFESGYFDCQKAGELLALEQKPGILRKGVFGIWDNRSLADLEAYIIKTYQTPHPLILTGFDFQFSGILSRDHFLPDLRSGLAANSDPDWPAFETTVRWQIKHSNFFSKTPPADTLLIQRFSEKIKKLNKGLFWKMCLDNLKADGQHRYQDINYRDRIMAQNLLNLIRNQYANEKIICWAASMHFIFQPEYIADPSFKNTVPMGQLLKKELKDQLYTIAFTSSEGKAGTVIPYRLKQAPKGSYEELLGNSKDNYAFTDLRAARADTNARQLIQCRMLGNSFMLMVLPQVADGLFYIRTSYPPR